MKFRITKPFIIGFSFLFIALIAVAASKEIRDSVVKIAEDQLGQFYEMDEYTGGWPPGFDCSGLVSYAYLKSGIKGFEGTTPNSHGPNTTALVNMSDIISGEPYPGDLVFRHSTYDKNKDGVVDDKDTYTHVGIYIGNDTIIHAGNPVQTAKLSEWKNDENKKIKFAGMRRIKAIYWPSNDNSYVAEERNEKLTAYKNPFQDLYDFYPKEGESQKCIKSVLGNKFISFYNGDSTPTKEDLKPAHRCLGGDESQFNFLPPAVQQCFKDVLGKNFDKPFTDPSFRIEPEAEKQITLCPAFQEFNAKAEALEKYIQPKKISTPVNSEQQSNAPQPPPQSIKPPFSAIEQRLRPGSSDYGKFYVYIGVQNCGNCIGVKGVSMEKDEAEKLARELSPNFLGYFEQRTIDFDEDYRPEAIEAMLLLAQEKGLIPRVSIKEGYYDGNGKFWSSDLWNKQSSTTGHKVTAVITDQFGNPAPNDSCWVSSGCIDRFGNPVQNRIPTNITTTVKHGDGHFDGLFKTDANGKTMDYSVLNGKVTLYIYKTLLDGPIHDTLIKTVDFEVHGSDVNLGTIKIDL